MGADLLKPWFIMGSFIFALTLPQALWSEERFIFEAGHPSLKGFLLPDTPPYPKDNEPTTDRVELGKKLFFDPRLSGDGNMSCATCHNPMLGWSDGLATARGFQSKLMGRASPTIINTAYNFLQMWDGGERTLEGQATGPMDSGLEMHSSVGAVLAWLSSSQEYSKLFAKAYPKEGISKKSLAKAIASFERTVISNNSPFDQWVRGDKAAMTAQQINGFKLFVDENKGNCEVCHSDGNFTDDGFHNIGLKSFSAENPDLGRYSERPLDLMKGAFKTPTLRNVTQTAPYFHDGSVQTLTAVVEHYVRGGDVKTNLSPSIKKLTLSKDEIKAIVAFLQALETEMKPVELPVLPL